MRAIIGIALCGLTLSGCAGFIEGGFSGGISNKGHRANHESEVGQAYKDSCQAALQAPNYQ